jgi:hypothetical protein
MIIILTLPLCSSSIPRQIISISNVSVPLVLRHPSFRKFHRWICHNWTCFIIYYLIVFQMAILLGPACGIVHRLQAPLDTSIPRKYSPTSGPRQILVDDTLF